MLMLTSYLIPFVLNVIGNSIIFVGILFMSARLMPSVLTTFYENSTAFTRLLIATIICFMPANLLISFIYKNNSACVAGVTNIMSAVLVVTTVAILADNIKINASIMFSLAVAMVSCGYLLYNIVK